MFKFSFAPCKDNKVIQDSLWILDSTQWISDSRYWIPDSLQSVELGFWIPIASGIPNSLSWIPDSKAQVSEFPTSRKISRILESLHYLTSWGDLVFQFTQYHWWFSFDLGIDRGNKEENIWFKMSNGDDLHVSYTNLEFLDQRVLVLNSF